MSTMRDAKAPLRILIRALGGEGGGDSAGGIGGVAGGRAVARS